MQIFLSLLLAFVFSMGCTSHSRHPDSSIESTADSSLRTPQYVSGADPDHEDEQKFENSFQAVMNEPTDEAKTESMAKFLRRQMGYFYLAQDMVNKFDAELDRLYKIKMANPKSELNTEALEKYQFQLNIGRELTERNIHELQFMYTRLLDEANNPSSPHKQASSRTLAGLDNFFKEKWIKQENKSALYSLAVEFQDISSKFKAAHANSTTIPNFQQITKKSQKELNQIFKLDEKKIELQRKSIMDPFIEKKWNETLSTRPFNPTKVIENRGPQASQIYPDPGPNGTINGSKFAPGVWTLTYDDGPHGTHTQSIINILEGAELKATFFWLSKNMKAYPSLVQKTGTQHGFRRASHSYSHANLPKLSDASLKHEIDDASVAFESVVGERPTFFRCPYGACGPNGGKIRQRIANNKMVHVMWNVDSLDWQDKNPQSIFQRVRKQMEVSGRGIILFHDIHGQTVEATKLLVSYLKSKPELKVLTLEKIVEMETGNEYHTP